MNEFATYEYVVERKNKGSKRLKPLFFIAGYAVLAIGFLLFAVISTIGAPLVALAPLALWIAVFLTWRYTKIEYEYSITSGVFTLSEIYGGRSRKVMVEFKLKDCLAIAPASEFGKRDEAETDRKYSALADANSPNAYFASFEDENGKRCVLFFEATEKALKICRFYNPSHTKVTKVTL